MTQMISVVSFENDAETIDFERKQSAVVLITLLAGPSYSLDNSCTFGIVYQVTHRSLGIQATSLSGFEGYILREM